jgi:hypothetical protein
LSKQSFPVKLISTQEKQFRVNPIRSSEDIWFGKLKNIDEDVMKAQYFKCHHEPWPVLNDDVEK